MINDPCLVRRVLSELAKLGGGLAVHAAPCKGQGSIKGKCPLCLVPHPWKMTGVIPFFFSFFWVRYN